MKKILNGLIVSLILSLSLGQIQRLSFFSQEVNLYFYEALMALFLVAFSVHYLIKLKFSIPKIIDAKLAAYKNNKTLVNSIYLFLGTLTASYLFTFSQFNNQQNLVAGMYLGRMFLYFIFFLCFYYYVKNEPNSLGLIKKTISAFFILTLIFSTVQYFLYPDLRNLYYLGWDPHLNRLFGTFFDISILGLFFTLAFFWFNNRMLQLYALLCIFFTYSRITYIAFLTSIFYCFYDKINWKKIVLIVGIFVAFLFALPRTTGVGVQLERTFSIEARISDNIQGINMAMKNPLLGVGYNHIRYAKNTQSLHSGASFASSYITILAGAGLLGLAALLYMLFVFYTRLNIGGRYLFFPVVLSSLFDNVMFTGFVLVMFLMLVAINLSHKKS